MCYYVDILTLYCVLGIYQLFHIHKWALLLGKILLLSPLTKRFPVPGWHLKLIQQTGWDMEVTGLAGRLSGARQFTSVFSSGTSNSKT